MKSLLKPALIPALTTLVVSIAIFEIAATVVYFNNITLSRFMGYSNAFFTALLSPIFYIFLLFLSWQIIKRFHKDAEWPAFELCAKNVLTGIAFYEAARLALAVLFLSDETPGYTMATLQNTKWFQYQKWLSYAFPIIFGSLLALLLIRTRKFSIGVVIIAAFVPFSAYLVLLLYKS